MTTMTDGPTTGRRGSAVPWRVDLVTAGAAAVCALVLWAAVTLLGGVDLLVRAGDGQVREVGAVAVALVAALAGLVGLGVLRLLERHSPRALRTWTWLSVVVLAVSLLGPLGATTAAGTGTLVALHAVVAAVLLVAAHRSRRAWVRTP